MPIDFPNSPTVGQVYTYQGKSWIWNGSGWDVPRALNELGAIRSFANAADRTAAIPSPTEGIVTYSQADDLLEFYNGSAYVGVNRNLQHRIRSLAADNNFSNATSFTDFTNAADKTALDMTFVKKRSSSSLLVTINASSFFNAGVSQRKAMGLNIAGTDYLIVKILVGDANARLIYSDSLLISGVAAGSLAIKPRFITFGASNDVFQNDTTVSYSVEEIF
jgi:hypothetical protein